MKEKDCRGKGCNTVVILGKTGFILYNGTGQAHIFCRSCYNKQDKSNSSGHHDGVSYKEIMDDARDEFRAAAMPRG
jgi:hypothetical protein